MVPTDPGEDGAATGRYRFGDIVVDTAAHTLLRAGELQSVEPKAFAVLLALLQRPGELIGRDDLLDRVWGHRHVTPGVLTRAIAQLRHALDDDSQRPRYIQTQHAVGYRFVGELQPEPVAADATMVVEAGTADVGFTSNTHEVDLPKRPRPVRTRLRVLVAAVLLIGAVAATWKMWGDRREAVPASIAILPFTSLSSDRSDGYFAEGLAVELHDALIGVPGLKVAAQMSPSAAMRRDTDVKAIGDRLGVATVLDASVRREGARLRISARLSDTSTGYTLWSRTYDRDSSSVFATQSEIAKQVVNELLGILPDKGHALTHRLAPTRSVPAYEAYVRGMGALRHASDDGSASIATIFFKEALAADHGFARAQAGLCRSELSRFESKQDAEIFDGAQAACLLASQMDPEIQEVNLALGDLYRIRGDSGKAIEQYMKAHKERKLRPAVYVGMGRAKSLQGRQDLALKYFVRARALRPDDAAIHRAIGFQHYLDENLAEAIASYREATRLEPENADTWSSLGGLYLADGNTTAAGAAFERSIGIEPTDIGLTNFGALKYADGDYVGAADLFRRATALEPGDFRLWGNLGEALLEIPGGTKQASQPFLRAAELAERYVQIKPDDAQALALLAWYRANLGDTAAARELAARAEVLATARGEVALRNAQTFATLGDPTAARERLQRARQAGVPDSRIETTPIFRRLSVIETGKAGTAR